MVLRTATTLDQEERRINHSQDSMSTHLWRRGWWALFVVWIACAILDVNHISAGLLTSYGADLTLPAWLYIATRSLDNPERNAWLTRLLGGSPGLAASTLFLASTATEVSQYVWPQGIFSGTFDLVDIAAYATGIGICYLIDKRKIEPSGQRSGGPPTPRL